MPPKLHPSAIVADGRRIGDVVRLERSLAADDRPHALVDGRMRLVG